VIFLNEMEADTARAFYEAALSYEQFGYKLESSRAIAKSETLSSSFDDFYRCVLIYKSLEMEEASIRCLHLAKDHALGFSQWNSLAELYCSVLGEVDLIKECISKAGKQASSSAEYSYLARTCFCIVEDKVLAYGYMKKAEELAVDFEHFYWIVAFYVEDIENFELAHQCLKSPRLKKALKEYHHYIFCAEVALKVKDMELANQNIDLANDVADTDEEKATCLQLKKNQEDFI